MFIFGSSSHTSSIKVASGLFFLKDNSAFSFTTSPRDVLMKIVLGFSFSKKLSLTKLYVGYSLVFVNGTCNVTISD